MNTLMIEPSDFSLKVVLDPNKNIFELSGESRPENTSMFYAPVLEWLEQYHHILYCEKDKIVKEVQRVFEFKLEYFNSSSARFIMDVLRQLDRMALEGCSVKVKWYYDKRDDDMKESGEEFFKALKKLPAEFVSL